MEGGETKNVLFKNHFHRFVVQKTLHVVNKNVLPVTIVYKQRICRNFHQACYDKIEVNATTEFSWTQCKTEIDYTIHIPKKYVIQFFIIQEKKQTKQNKKKKERKNAVQVLTNISIVWIKFIMDRQV